MFGRKSTKLSSKTNKPNRLVGFIKNHKKISLAVLVIVLAVGGYFGYSAYQDMNAKAASIEDCKGTNLKSGSRGECVKALQTALNTYFINKGGTGLAPLAVDGSYGPKTIAAVYTYQRIKGFKQDGITGPQTWGGIVNDSLPVIVIPDVWNDGTTTSTTSTTSTTTANTTTDLSKYPTTESECKQRNGTWKYIGSTLGCSLPEKECKASGGTWKYIGSTLGCEAPAKPSTTTTAPTTLTTTTTSKTTPYYGSGSNYGWYKIGTKASSFTSPLTKTTYSWTGDIYACKAVSSESTKVKAYVKITSGSLTGYQFRVRLSYSIGSTTDAFYSGTLSQSKTGYTSYTSLVKNASNVEVGYYNASTKKFVAFLKVSVGSLTNCY